MALTRSFNIDHIGFICGGYGSLGVAMYTFHLYKGLPRPVVVENQDEEVEVEVVDAYHLRLRKSVLRTCKIAGVFGLVQLRAIERFLIGGCLYTGISHFSTSFGLRSNPLKALIAGGIVGAYESGYEASWTTLLECTATVACTCSSLELLLISLHKKGLLLHRPSNLFTLDYDPFLYIVGAIGAYALGLYTNSFEQDLYFPQWPEYDENREFMETVRSRMRFGLKSLFSFMTYEVRVEERFLLGGSLSWFVEHCLRKVGVENKLIQATFCSGVVGAYFGTYGGLDAVVKGGLGLSCFGMMAHLFLAQSFDEEEMWYFITNGM